MSIIPTMLVMCNLVVAAPRVSDRDDHDARSLAALYFDALSAGSPTAYSGMAQVTWSDREEAAYNLFNVFTTPNAWRVECQSYIALPSVSDVCSLARTDTAICRTADRVLLRQTPGNQPVIKRYVSDQWSSDELLRSILLGGEILDGKCSLLGGTVHTAIDNAVRVEPLSYEFINGVPTFQLTCYGTYGELRLWLAPTLGWRPLRIDIATHVNSYDLTLQVDNINMSTISHVPVATSARITSRHWRPGDTTTAVTSVCWYSRTIHSINKATTLLPDQFAIQAPNGTRVTDEESPTLELEWRDGGISIAGDTDTEGNIRLIASAIRCGAVSTTLALPSPKARNVQRVDKYTAGGLVREQGIYYVAPRPPYCGVHCLFAASMALGLEYPFTTLLQSMYLSKDGSSFSQLTLAARNVGLNATPLEGLSVEALVEAREPLILRVATLPGDFREEAHFVLFLGMSGCKALIYDAPGPLQRISLSELRDRWKGNALAISQLEGPPSSLKGDRRHAIRFAALVATLMCALGLIYWLCSRHVESSLSGRVVVTANQAIGVLLLSALWGLLHNLMSPAGLSYNELYERSVGRPVERIDVTTMKSVVANGGIIIDARTTTDFAAGHIPGAINMWPRMGLSERLVALNAVDRSLPVVVYCKGEECPAAEVLANELIADGFVYISIFEGGWDEWRLLASNIGIKAREQEPQ